MKLNTKLKHEHRLSQRQTLPNLVNTGQPLHLVDSTWRQVHTAYCDPGRVNRVKSVGSESNSEALGALTRVELIVTEMYRTSPASPALT